MGQKKLNALLREGSVVRAEDLLPMAQLGDGITGPAVIAKTPAKLNLPNRAVTFEGIRFVSDKGNVTLKGAANTNVTFIECAAHRRGGAARWSAAREPGDWDGGPRRPGPRTFRWIAPVDQQL